MVKLVAYAISEGGSDWRKVIVMDAITKESPGRHHSRMLNLVDFPGIKTKDFTIRVTISLTAVNYLPKRINTNLYYHQAGHHSKQKIKVIYGLEAKEKVCVSDTSLKTIDTSCHQCGKMQLRGTNLYIQGFEQ